MRVLSIVISGILIALLGILCLSIVLSISGFFIYIVVVMVEAILVS